jgi:hypothetical protein
MYMHSNVYTKKTSSVLLLSLLLVSALVMLVPIAVVHATITGTPVLGVANKSGTPAPTAFTPATTSVDVIAGTSSVGPIATGCDGGVCAYTPSFFGINFNGVTFSGAQFYLYLSTNGFANVNTSGSTPDIRYAGPFSASALTGAGALVAVGLATGIVGDNYWIGSPGAGEDLVVGPIPVEISTAYQYVKVYDGSCGANPSFCGGTGVAGAKQLINVQPGITIDVTKGPAWTSVHVSGGGFPTNMHVNINGTYTTFEWTTGAATLHHVAVSTDIATGPGYFGPVLMSMVDTGQGYNAHGGDYATTAITLSATNSSKITQLMNVAQNGINPPVFNEYNRVFNQVVSYFSGAVQDFVTYGTYGNSSAATSPASVAPYLPSQPIPVYITGTLGIVGTNFTVGGSVSIWIGGVQLVGSPVTATASGGFIANVTVPDLPQGPNHVEVLNNGVKYWFDIVVEPTLILTPDSGVTTSEAPTGDVVTVSAYGFPANMWVSLWWNEYTLGDGNDYFLLNSTIDTAGSYNHTITFNVPPDVYGGAHLVQATTANWPATTLETSVAGSGFVSQATFTVIPSITITPSSVNSNAKGVFAVDGDGFDPSKLYYVNIDNSLSLSGAPGLQAGPDGDLNINFTSAGFRPGTHQIEVFDWVSQLGSGSYAPTAWAYFNVTLTGDLEGNAIASLTSSLTSIQTSLTAVQTSLSSVQSSLTSIMGSLSAVQSSLSSITSTLSSVTSSLSSVSSSLSSISSTVGSIQSSLTTITGDVSGLGTQLSSLQSSATSIQNAASSLTTSVGNLGTQLTGIQNSLTSMGSQLTGIATSSSNAASSAATAATEATDAVNGSATAQTYVLVVAVLAAITLVLELAILVRKLS